MRLDLADCHWLLSLFSLFFLLFSLIRFLFGYRGYSDWGGNWSTHRGSLNWCGLFWLSGLLLLVNFHYFLFGWLLHNLGHNKVCVNDWGFWCWFCLLGSWDRLASGSFSRTFFVCFIQNVLGCFFLSILLFYIYLLPRLFSSFTLLGSNLFRLLLLLLLSLSLLLQSLCLRLLFLG